MMHTRRTSETGTSANQRQYCIHNDASMTLNQRVPGSSPGGTTKRRPVAARFTGLPVLPSLASCLIFSAYLPPVFRGICTTATQPVFQRSGTVCPAIP